MEFCGLPQPPRPPPKFSMPDLGAREAPTAPYPPSDFNFLSQMEPGFAPPMQGPPVQPEMNYLPTHTDYTYIVPLPPGVYPNATIPNAPQQPMFWTAPTEVVPQFNPQISQPPANTKVTEWACDTSFNTPYNSTQTAVTHAVVPMHANFYNPASQ
eukprot:GGOE01054426.1.p2 GENE.GGOE01054426.1~~GGOE01054426.1.p2  ORF type:complete len:155 (-),score=21.75 GGOE01054426.1:18-482(-)